MKTEPTTHHVIAGIVVHPSGFNLVLRNGQAIFIDVGMVHKGFGLLRRINGPGWGDPDEWAETDTEAFMNGYPIVSYTDNDRKVWERVEKSDQLQKGWTAIAARQTKVIAELRAEIEAAQAAHAGDGQPHKLTDALAEILRKHGYELNSSPQQ